MADSEDNPTLGSPEPTIEDRVLKLEQELFKARTYFGAAAFFAVSFLGLLGYKSLFEIPERLDKAIDQQRAYLLSELEKEVTKQTGLIAPRIISEQAPAIVRKAVDDIAKEIAPVRTDQIIRHKINLEMEKNIGPLAEEIARKNVDKLSSKQTEIIDSIISQRDEVVRELEEIESTQQDMLSIIQAKIAQLESDKEPAKPVTIFSGRWAKKNYFLSLPDNYKLSIIDIDKSSSRVKIEVQDKDDKSSGQQILLTVNEYYPFDTPAWKYKLRLSKIDSAGYNPLNNAAFFELERLGPTSSGK